METHCSCPIYFFGYIGKKNTPTQALQIADCMCLRCNIRTHNDANAKVCDSCLTALLVRLNATNTLNISLTSLVRNISQPLVQKPIFQFFRWTPLTDAFEPPNSRTSKHCVLFGSRSPLLPTKLGFFVQVMVFSLVKHENAQLTKASRNWNLPNILLANCWVLVLQWGQWRSSRRHEP